MGPCATMLPRQRWAAREQRTCARPQRVARGRRLLGSGSFPGCTRPRGTHSRWCPGRKCCPAVVPWVLPGQGELQHLPNTLPLTAAPQPMSQGHPQPLRRLHGGRAHVAGESGAVPKACRDPTRIRTFVSLSKLKSSDSGKTASPASQRHIPNPSTDAVRIACSDSKDDFVVHRQDKKNTQLVYEACSCYCST